MKHPWTTTASLILLFLISQVIGLSLLYTSLNVYVTDGTQQVLYEDTALGERPALEGASSLIFLIAGVAIGTAMLLLIIRWKALHLWKLWFFLAVLLALTIAFGVLIPFWHAFILALILAGWKVMRPNAIIHNSTEIFMYAGIAILIVPLFDLTWAIVLLVLISIYDVIAVWHSKHMVKMAEAQTKSNLFAGLYLPKKGPKVKLGEKVTTKKSGGAAILGGGDIAFPLLFAGVVMKWLIERMGHPPFTALLVSLTVAFTTAAALFLLFYFAKKDRYYPAMPFLTAGCFLGLLIVALF